MTHSNHSRRRFIRQSALTGMATVLGLGITPSAFPHTKQQNVSLAKEDKKLNIRPRYHRWHVDPGVEWLETNTGYAYLDWAIPLSQVALVLVDVWQRHYIKEPEERAEIIINNNLLPVVTKCREEGLQIIHAPSRKVAMRSPNWVKLAPGPDRFYPPDNWPSSDFREKKNVYKPFGRPFEPREAERLALPPLDFHPKIVPVGNEAVICSGEELHQYCKKKGILFLLYAGFNTNGCIISRTYGAINMTNRGYEALLLRDCTTGMESKETQAELKQTNAAILLLEMFGICSITSGEVLHGIR